MVMESTGFPWNRHDLYRIGMMLIESERFSRNRKDSHGINKLLLNLLESFRFHTNPMDSIKIMPIQ